MVTGVDVFAYCVMPDHLHLLIRPSPTTSVNTFVGQVKNLGQRAAWSLGVRGAFWQRSFWDHYLRPSEDPYAVIDYIVNNPVRRGLVREWRDYPYAGDHERLFDGGPPFHDAA